MKGLFLLYFQEEKRQCRCNYSLINHNNVIERQGRVRPFLRFHNLPLEIVSGMDTAAAGHRLTAWGGAIRKNITVPTDLVSGASIIYYRRIKVGSGRESMPTREVNDQNL